MTTVSDSSIRAASIFSSGKEGIGLAYRSTPPIRRICHTPDFYMSAYECHDHILTYTQRGKFELCN